MTVTAYGPNAETAVDQAQQEIERLDALLSTGEKTSEVAQINANGGGTLSEDTTYLLERSLDLYDSTNGVFDIAIYPIMDAGVLQPEIIRFLRMRRSKASFR